jgi:hypothetical protein
LHEIESKNINKEPHSRALRPPDGAYTSPLARTEARVLTDIDASFDIFYKPTGHEYSS